VSVLFRRILVPHDLSERASEALRVAAEIARDAAGEVLVVLVLTPVTSLAGISPPGHPVWLPSDEEVAGARAQLGSLVEDALGPHDSPTVKIQVLVGDPFAEIMRQARKASCIVMATQGRTGLAHLLIGSLAEKLVRHAPVPVLTVRSTAAGRVLDRASGGDSLRPRRARDGRGVPDQK